jgi:hypothetical protein
MLKEIGSACSSPSTDDEQELVAEIKKNFFFLPFPGFCLLPIRFVLLFIFLFFSSLFCVFCFSSLFLLQIFHHINIVYKVLLRETFRVAITDKVPLPLRHFTLPFFALLSTFSLDRLASTTSWK